MNRSRDKGGKLPVKVNREKTCPLLLRVFTRKGRLPSAEEFEATEMPKEEMQIYTWKDATLGELTRLIRGVRKHARRPQARLGFGFVYPGRDGKLTLRRVGTTYASRRCEDENKSLAQLDFEIGDILCVAIY